MDKKLFALSLISLIGCSTLQRGLIKDTNYQRPSISYSTPDHIRKHELRKVTNLDSLYSLERVVINGNDLYVQQNNRKRESELDFYLVRFEDHRKILNSLENEAQITSDFLYLPTQFKVKITENGKEVEKPARKMPLKNEGNFSISAKITRYDTSNLDLGIIKENQKDTAFKIKTIAIKNEEYYTPVVEDSQLANQDALNFYIADVENTIKEIDSNGNITLITDNGIFHPLKISRKDYESRPLKSAKETIGQASQPSN